MTAAASLQWPVDVSESIALPRCLPSRSLLPSGARMRAVGCGLAWPLRLSDWPATWWCLTVVRTTTNPAAATRVSLSGTGLPRMVLRIGACALVAESLGSLGRRGPGLDRTCHHSARARALRATSARFIEVTGASDGVTAPGLFLNGRHPCRARDPRGFLSQPERCSAGPGQPFQHPSNAVAAQAGLPEITRGRGSRGRWQAGWGGEARCSPGEPAADDHRG